MNRLTPKQFRALIVANTGLSVDEFAKTKKLSAKTLYKAMNTGIATERVQMVLAEGAGVPRSFLFPDTKKAPSSGQNTAVNVGTAMTVPEDGHLSQQKVG